MKQNFESKVKKYLESTGCEVYQNITTAFLHTHTFLVFKENTQPMLVWCKEEGIVCKADLVIMRSVYVGAARQSTVPMIAYKNKKNRLVIEKIENGGIYNE